MPLCLCGDRSVVVSTLLRSKPELASSTITLRNISHPGPRPAADDRPQANTKRCRSYHNHEKIAPDAAPPAVRSELAEEVPNQRPAVHSTRKGWSGS